MARTRVRRVNINRSAVIAIANSPRAQAFLAYQADRINDEALRWYLVQQKGQATAPTFYVKSFKIRRIRRGAIAAWQAYNDDPTALWVEFGAHAGGKTPVLKYRPYGKAIMSLIIR